MSKKYNNADTTLAGDLQASGTSFVVKTGEGALFPSSGFPYEITLEHYEGLIVTKREILTISARAGDAFTISVRASQTCVQDDSAAPKIRTANALSFVSGDRVYITINENDINNLETEIYTNIPATYATKAEAQNKASTYGATTTGNDGYAITLSPAPTSLASLKGAISFLTDVANIGNATLNINGLGAKNILKNNDVILNDGDIEANQIVSVIYNATDDVFEMISQTAQSTGQIKTITTNYTTTDQDETILGDATAGDIDLILGSTIVGKRYNIKLKAQTVTPENWATKALMPTARGGMAVGVINNKIYYIGGYNGGYININEEYDPITDTWATKASLPTTRGFMGFGVINNKIYCIGGQTTTYFTTNEEYDPVTNTWTTKAPMPTARSVFAFGTINNKIYCIGGYNFSIVNKNEEYDPVTNTWTTKANTPIVRYEHTGAVYNNKLYMIGGYNGTSFLTTNEEYDPATDTYNSKASMPTARQSPGNGVVGNKIYVISGYNGVNLTTNEEYDPVTNTWATKAPMPTASTHCIGVIYGSAIYMIGGNNGATGLNQNHKYTPTKYNGINLIGTIDGTVNKTINTIKEAIEVIYNGTDWEILSKYL